MAIQKKHIWIGVGIAVTALGIWLYSQYNKIMEYALKFKGVKLHVFGMDAVVFDLVLAFTNNSDISFRIVSQEYKVYLNDKQVSNVDSDKEQLIQANSTSDIAVNVKFSPKTAIAAVNMNEFLLNKQGINLKVDVKVKIALGPLKVSVHYTYKGSLKDLINNPKKA